MPRDPAFYQQPRQVTAPAADPAASLPSGSPEKVKASQQNQQVAQTGANRSFMSFLGEGFREIFTGSQPNWDQMSSVDKQAAVVSGVGKLAVDTITAIPKTIAKAPVAVALSATEAVEDIAHFVDKTGARIFGGQEYFQDKPKNRNINIPFLGETQGYRQTYQDAAAMGNGGFWDNTLAAISATGKVAGDVAITAALTNAIRGGFQSSLSKVQGVKPGVGPDPRPMVQTQLSKLKQKVSSQSPTTFKQNPKDGWVPVIQGGKPTGSYFRITPLGNGTAEFTVYNTKPALFKNPFSKAKPNTVDTPFGKLTAGESGIIKYNEPRPGPAVSSVPVVTQGLKVYRGGPALDQTQVTGRGIPVTVDRTVAETFVREKSFFDQGPAGQIMGKDPAKNIIEEYEISPTAKIATKNDIPPELYQAYKDTNPLVNPEKGELMIGEWAKANGFDAVDYRTLGETSAKEAEIKVINPSVLQKSSGPIDSSLPTTTSIAEQAVELTKKNGGVTINLKGDVPTQGYAVAPNKATETIIPKEQYAADPVTAIEKYIVQHLQELQAGEAHFGGWINENGDFVADVSHVVDTPYKAANIAQAGNQDAFTNLSDFNATTRDQYQKIISDGENVPGGNAAPVRGADPLVDQGQNADLPDFGPQPTAIDSAAGASLEAKAKKQDIINTVVTGTGVPSVMQRPLKGSETAPVDPRQISQITTVAKNRGFNPETVSAMAKSIFGKPLSELNQTEAFDVAETVRLYGETQTLPGQGDINAIRPFIQPARYWMEAVETSADMGYPLITKVYNPVETGFQLADSLTRSLVTEFNNVLGKYANPSKYLEEGRLLDAYTRGNKEAISGNKTLTPEAKAELTKIGDWLVNYYDKARIAGNIQSTKYAGQYAPDISQRGGIVGRYKTDDLPEDLKPFFEFERLGMDVPLEDDARALFGIHAKTFARNKFLREPMKEAVAMKDGLPAEAANVKKGVNDYLQERMGYQGNVEKTINRWSTQLSNSNYGKAAGLGPDILRQMVKTITSNIYAGAIGIPRLMPIIVNTFQILTHGWANFPDKYFAAGLKRALTKQGMTDTANRGATIDVGDPYGGELAARAGAGVVSKGLQMYEDLSRATLKPQSSTDNFSRAVIDHATRAQFEDNWPQFLEGKMDLPEFEKAINMDGFSVPIQNIIRKKLAQNTPESIEEAMNVMSRENIDSTIFPYRKGSGTRAQYGMVGNLAGMFSKWPVENAHTLLTWMKRGQWGKLLKWYAASTTLKRTFEEAYGIDISRYVGLNTLTGVGLGPAANGIVELFKGIAQTTDGTAQEADKHFQAVYDTLKLVGGVPFGIGSQRLQHFFKAVDKVREGILQSTETDPLRRWPILTKNGNTVRSWVKFVDLLKYTFGATPSITQEESKVNQKIIEDQDANSQRLIQASDALSSGDYAKFDQIITKYNLQTDWAQKIQHDTLPTKLKLWNKMPASLKEKYVDMLFPQ